MTCMPGKWKIGQIFAKFGRIRYYSRFSCMTCSVITSVGMGGGSCSPEFTPGAKWTDLNDGGGGRTSSPGNNVSIIFCFITIYFFNFDWWKRGRASSLEKKRWRWRWWISHLPRQPDWGCPTLWGFLAFCSRTPTFGELWLQIIMIK